MFLRELTGQVTSLKGVGAVTSAQLANIGITTVADLLVHYPRGYEDRQTKTPLTHSAPDRPVNTVVTVTDHEYIGHGRNATLKIRVEDGTAEAALVCFGRNFLARSLSPGRKFFLYGHFSYKFGELQASAFETEPFSEHPLGFGAILPIYPLTGTLTQGFFRKAIRSALELYGNDLEDELPDELSGQPGFSNKGDCIREIHFPSNRRSIERSRHFLKYEELFYLQLTVKRRAQKIKARGRKPRQLDDRLCAELEARLPFELTPDQRTVLQEIRKDLESDSPMARLLQGDVGCGKTLVAFLSALLVVGDGGQTAMMAPTELLARQHAESAAALLEPIGIRVALLSGTVKQEPRRQLLRALKEGAVDIVLGTHALFSADVAFRKLALVVVDEQHRFGVLQRMALLDKGSGADAPSPDLLLMTATPIPRSLALTVFGDLDVSTIRTMPHGRKPVATHLARIGNEKKVYEWVRTEIERGHQAYFVYPLIQASAVLDLKDAESMFDRLAKVVFPDIRLGLIHSRLGEDEKLETMNEFQRGKIKILVATSVVEVGVNVPNATCMVVEHAERFGLPALHQLRGRVGRAEHQSYAFLVYNTEITDDARTRLRAMKTSNDGFVIAEQDLLIRGPGDLVGVRQSGRFKLTIADIALDIDLLKTARSEVEKLLREDPGLIDPRHACIRKVLNNAPPFMEEFAAGG